MITTLFIDMLAKIFNIPFPQTPDFLEEILVVLLLICDGVWLNLVFRVFRFFRK